MHCFSFSTAIVCHQCVLNCYCVTECYVTIITNNCNSGHHNIRRTFWWQREKILSFQIFSFLFQKKILQIFILRTEYWTVNLNWRDELGCGPHTTEIPYLNVCVKSLPPSPKLFSIFYVRFDRWEQLKVETPRELLLTIALSQIKYQVLKGVSVEDSKYG